MRFYAQRGEHGLQDHGCSTYVAKCSHQECGQDVGFPLDDHFVTVNVCLSVIYCFFIPWKISPFVRLSLQQLLDSSKTVIGGSEDSSSCEP
jgi:hypothetical protein